MSSHTEWEAIRSELLAMSRADRDVREELARDGSLADGYRPRMAEIHRRNGERLKSIVNARGWPGVSRVGPEAAEAAWLIVQHGIGQPDLMRRGLAAVEADLRRRREAIASSTERPPADWERRRETLEAWLRKVAWRP